MTIDEAAGLDEGDGGKGVVGDVGVEVGSVLDVGGDQFTMIRDVLESLGIGKIAVEAVPSSPEASDG